jgi:hypothetical protein
MKIKNPKNPLNSLHDNLTVHLKRHETPEASQEQLGRKAIRALRQNDLLHPPANNNDPQFLLADSIAMLNSGGFSEAQDEVIRQSIQTGAEIFVAQIFSGHRLSSGDRSSIAMEQSQFLPPSLEDVLLLVRAFDATQDKNLLQTVNYILKTTPPAFSELLLDAVILAEKHRSPIMTEFQRLMAEADTQLDKPKTREEYRFVQHMRNATPNRYRATPVTEEELDQTRG